MPHFDRNPYDRTTFFKPWKKLVRTLLWSLVRDGSGIQRLFSWLEKTLPVMLRKICGLTLVRDRMLTQNEQYSNVLKPCYRGENALPISLFS